MQSQKQNDADDEDHSTGLSLENSAHLITLQPDEELYFDYDDENFDIFNPDQSLKKRRKASQPPSATALQTSGASDAPSCFVAAKDTGVDKDAARHSSATTGMSSDNANENGSLGWRLLSKLGYDAKSGKGLGPVGHEGMAEAIPLHQKKVERAGLGHRDALARTEAGRVEKKSAEQKHKDKMARRASEKAKEAAKKKRDALLHKAFYDPKHLDLSGI